MALSKQQNVGKTKLETPTQTIPILKEPTIPLDTNTGMPENKNGNGNAGFTLNRNLLIVGVILFFLLGMD